MQKVTRYFIFLFIFYILYAISNNYQELQNQKIQNSNLLVNEKKILGKKLAHLEKVKNDYSARLEFISSNKLSLDDYTFKISSTLNKINSINGFNIIVEKKKLSKVFINVGLIKLKLTSHLKMFNISEFENIFRRELSQIGYVLPFEYTNKSKNEAKINIIVLKYIKKKDSKNENK